MSSTDRRHRKNTSGRYVSWDKNNEKWISRVRFGQKIHYVGRFESETTAKRRANAFASMGDE